VRSSQRWPDGGDSGAIMSSSTDAEGRFVLRDLRRGLTYLTVHYGRIQKGNNYLADGSSNEVRIQLPERPREPDRGARDILRGEPIAIGQPAPEWRVGPWSDGRSRQLEDVRGKVVVLYFWNTGIGQSVSALTAIGKLGAQFETRDVVFMAIHGCNEDEESLQEMTRRLFAFKKVRLESTVDQPYIDPFTPGATKQRYGIRDHPTVIVIDRDGRVAFRSDTTMGDRNLAAVFNRIASYPTTMTEEDANQRTADALALEIENALRKQDSSFASGVYKK
jgi:peroxiredoxin